MAAFFWTKEYFVFIVLLALLVSLVLSFTAKSLKKTLPIALLVLISTIWFGQKEHKNYLFVNRIGQYDRECQEVGAVDVYSHPFTTMALYETRKRSDSPSTCSPIMPSRRYVIDGHISHNVWSGMEFISGLSSAQYFDRPLKNSVVIGIGSGQAAWAVAAISEFTQLVEISPVVIDNLDHIKELNGDLKNRSGIEFILDDGFSFIRECKAGSLDLIFNTSTYPSSFNASKLYSDEFVGMAKRCLAKDGVYQTYFDESSVRDMRTLNEFLAPIQKHFEYVDVQTYPYPQVFAYNVPKQIQKLSAADFLRPEDYKYFYADHAQDFDLACFPVFRMIARPTYVPRMNTLDRAYLEENSILSAVDVAHSDSVAIYSLSEIYEPIPGSKPMPTCE
jgi:spermidine synthase